VSAAVLNYTLLRTEFQLRKLLGSPSLSYRSFTNTFASGYRMLVIRKRRDLLVLVSSDEHTWPEHLVIGASSE